jgi:high-affinity iron transporter
MLPSFVIGLREGVEAALIVGIIASFLRQEGRRDALRPMWAGVVAAIVICAAVGGVLELLDKELPQRRQEGLETVIGVAAIGIVSFMIVWMRRHARGLSGQLRDSARAALASGSASALVAMAFFAVIREGLETVVFLLAVFQSADDPAVAGLGALLGLAVAVAIGALVYSGGVRLNLARFFRITGFVLVLVAAGLVASTLHSAHEAGWLNAGQGQALDLTWLVVPGSWTSALLTGMLGWQPLPTYAELLGYLVYLIPAAVYVLWPAGVPLTRRATATA